MLDGDSEHSKAKGVNRNVVATISQNKYKDGWLKNKCQKGQWIELKVNAIE